MSPEQIVAIVIAVGGLLGGAFTGLRQLFGDRFKRDIEASANILSGLNTLVKTLQEELGRVKVDHQRDRDEWIRERTQLRKEHADEIHTLNERIDELGTQVWALQNRPMETRERSSDS